MEIQKYVDHYLELNECLKFLGLTILVISVAFVLLCICVKAGDKKDREKEEVWEHIFLTLDKFSELIFSGTSILMFMAGYYLIERFVTFEPYVTIWGRYRDFLLLLFIVVSCLFNSALDGLLIRLKCIPQNEKASMRLLGMLYMIMIFGYIKFIYEDNNYDFFISYFLGLIIGRFVYFDASFKEFWSAVTGAARSIPIMLFALACTGTLSLYGFATKYLIKHIGVITNVFFIHLFMCTAIFILYHSRILKLVSSSKK